MSNTLGSRGNGFRRLAPRHVTRPRLSASGHRADQHHRTAFRPALSLRSTAPVQAFAASPAGRVVVPQVSRATSMVLGRDVGQRVFARSPIAGCGRSLVPARFLARPEDPHPTSRQRVQRCSTAQGANATPGLSFGEVYSALVPGRDRTGRKTPAEVVDSGRFYEVQGYMSLSNHVYLPTFLVSVSPTSPAIDPALAEAMMTSPPRRPPGPSHGETRPTPA